MARATQNVIPDCDVATNAPTSEHDEAAATPYERNSWRLCGAARLTEIAFSCAFESIGCHSQDARHG
jgi:hypothetical protein